jgi:hypothetical protein
VHTAWFFEATYHIRGSTHFARLPLTTKTFEKNTSTSDRTGHPRYWRASQLCFYHDTVYIQLVRPGNLSNLDPREPTFDWWQIILTKQAKQSSYLHVLGLVPQPMYPKVYISSIPRNAHYLHAEENGQEVNEGAPARAQKIAAELKVHSRLHFMSEYRLSLT